LTFVSEAANPAGNAINIQLTGRYFEDLNAAGDRIKKQLDTYAGIFDVRDSYSAGKDEINLKILPSARAAGFSQADLARQVRGAFFGEEVQRIQRGRDEIKIMVRYPSEARSELAALEDMWIRNSQGDPMPIRNAADLEIGEGFSEIKRIDRRRAINVFADANDDVANVEDILEDLREKVFPDLQRDFPSVNVSFEGESREQKDIRMSMARGAALAALIIYALLAVPFRSYTQPLIIMSVIPFGIVGAIAGHWLTGQSFSILSLLGLVALSGVVVNDSLVLVDFINQQVREGKPLIPAVREAGTRRFRPVILTSLTTFVGLIPILLETNLQAQFLIPMATSLAFGILYATFITLLLVPAVYLILEDIKDLVRKEKKHQTDPSLVK
jgi:multidrug efflux pump subunit AcrB